MLLGGNTFVDGFRAGGRLDAGADSHAICCGSIKLLASAQVKIFPVGIFADTSPPFLFANIHSILLINSLHLHIVLIHSHSHFFFILLSSLKTSVDIQNILFGTESLQKFRFLPPPPSSLSPNFYPSLCPFPFPAPFQTQPMLVHYSPPKSTTNIHHGKG